MSKFFLLCHYDFCLKCNFDLQERSTALKLKDEKASVNIQNDKLLGELVRFGFHALHYMCSCLMTLISSYENLHNYTNLI